MCFRSQFRSELQVLHVKSQRLFEVSQLEVGLTNHAEEIRKDVDLVWKCARRLVDVVNQLLGVVNGAMVLVLLQHCKQVTI